MMKKIVANVVGASLVLMAVLWALDVHRFLGFNLYKGQYLYALMALTISIIYLTYPSLPNKPKLTVLIDFPLAAIGAFSALYIAVHFDVLTDNANAYDFQLTGMVLAGVMIISLIEGVRRSAGNALAVIVVASIVLAIAASALPAPFTGREFRVGSFLYNMAYLEGNILGHPTAVVGSIVIAYVLMGAVLLRTGGGEFFSALASALFGGSRGGSAKIAITASAMFGSISGSAVSNTVSTGMLTIPMMRKAGYRPEIAAALEAVASTGGQLAPPVMGAAAFLMAVTIEVDYTVVVVAALIPAALYYLALFLQIDLIAARDGIKGIDRAERPSALRELRDGWVFILPFAVLLIGLFVFHWRPEFAALAATFSIIVFLYLLGVRGKRPALRTWLEAAYDAAKHSVGVIVIAACAGIVIGALNISGVMFLLTDMIISLGGTNLVALLALSAFLCIILGMGMPTVGVYALLSTLVAAPLEQVGIDKIAAHLFVLYFGMMSMITPPVAVVSFTAASIAGTPAMKTGWEAMKLAWSAYIIPFVFIANPALIANGDIGEMLLAILRSVLGIWLVCGSIVGFSQRQLKGLSRIGYASLGIMLLLPKGVVPANMGLVFGLATLAIGAAIVTFERLLVRQKRMVASG